MTLPRPAGQALIVACLMALVLSLALATTFHLGQSIQSRIRLQNTADAAAYSTAAMEARAFNLYSFANRTQVSHYVSAMAWMSLDSFLYFVEAFLADMYGFLKTVDVCGGIPVLPWTLVCPILIGLPFIGSLLQAVDALLGVFRVLVESYHALLVGTDPDAVIGRDVIPAHWTLNAVMAGASTAMMQGALAEVVGSSPEVVAENDLAAREDPNGTPTGPLNACLFDRAHYRESNGSPLAPRVSPTELDPTKVLDSDKVARAKRVMGAIANATRFPCDGPGQCPTGFITSRDNAESVPLPGWAQGLADLFGTQHDHPAGTLDAGKMGQTRMLSTRYTNGQGATRRMSYLRDWRDPPGYGIGELAAADNLAADDLYWLKVGPVGNPLACSATATAKDPCWGDPHKGKHEPGDGTFDQPYRYMVKTSVWALNRAEGIPGGLHWRVDYGATCHGSECAIGVTKKSVCVVGPCGRGHPGVAVYTANIRPLHDGNHAWSGTAPFPHFEPGQFRAACPASGSPSSKDAASYASEFNQPSSWVSLAEEMPGPSSAPGLLDARAKLTFGLAQSSRALSLPGSSLHALARAQTYYHRPGNWAEQPNFFNPYWRPRLASAIQGRPSLPVAPDLAAFAPGVPAQKVLTH